MEKTSNFGRTITLKMKKIDFQSLTRSKTYIQEIREENLFIEQVKMLLEQHWQDAGEVRLLGVAVSNLEKDHNGEGVQLKLNL